MHHSLIKRNTFDFFYYDTYIISAESEINDRRVPFILERTVSPFYAQRVILE